MRWFEDKHATAYPGLRNVTGDTGAPIWLLKMAKTESVKYLRDQKKLTQKARFATKLRNFPRVRKYDLSTGYSSKLADVTIPDVLSRC